MFDDADTTIDPVEITRCIKLPEQRATGTVSTTSSEANLAALSSAAVFPGPTGASCDTLLEPATTNMILNPSAESSLSSWSANAGTLVRDTSRAKVGAASARYTYTASGNGNGYLPVYATITQPNTTYSTSAYVYAEVPFKVRAVLYMQTTDTTGSGCMCSPAFDTPMLEPHRWHRIVHTTTTRPDWPANSTGWVILRPAYGADNNYLLNTPIWWDGVQVEQRTSPTSYVDGALGTGYSWTGSAHGSPSSRNANVAVN